MRTRARSVAESLAMMILRQQSGLFINMKRYTQRMSTDGVQMRNTNDVPIGNLLLY